MDKKERFTMEKNNKELQVPKFMAQQGNRPQKTTDKREISKPKKVENKKYKPSHNKMLNKIRKLLTIAAVSASLGVSAMTGIAVYNNQQTTRQAQSYDKQITEYNKELYNKIQNLKEEGLNKLSNDELRMLINEVNENNYQALKDKIANIIPDFSGNLTIMRHEESSGDVTFSASYGDKYNEKSFTIGDSRITGAVDRYIGVRELVEDTENGDVDRSKLEKNLNNLQREMNEDSDIGVYWNKRRN